MTPSFRIIGPGRAGGSIARALATVGWTHLGSLGRTDDLADAADDVDLVVVAVPDAAIASVARRIRPGRAAVIHLAGSRPLDDLRPHARVGSVHPLMSLPDPDTGARRLLDHGYFAVDGDPIASDIVTALGGVPVPVAESDRVVYHAAAAIASNHLVALCAQVERLAASVGVPADAYWQMMSDTLSNVATVGSAEALTGPAARGDWDTVAAHLHDLPPRERPLYLALGRAAAELADRAWPARLDHDHDDHQDPEPGFP